MIRVPVSRLAALFLVCAAGAVAAAETGTSNAFKGFGGNKDPIQIEADNLGVVGPDQIVTISGNVQVRQKTTTLTTQELKVYYENKPGAAPTPDQTASGAQLRRFEAAGGLKITQPDQMVTGDSGWFDMPSQKAEVTGNVVLTQGRNIARGSKLQINLKTGQYNLIGGGPTGRIQLMIDPGEKVPAAKDEPAPAPKTK